MKILLLDIKGSHERSPHRYESWRDTFGEDNFAIIYPGDLEAEIDTGDKAKVHYLSGNLEAVPVENHGTSCDLFLAREFVDDFGSLPDLSQIDRTMSYVEGLREDGQIGSVVNSRKGTLNQKDKLTDIVMGRELGVAVPETHHFSSHEDLRVFIHGSSDSYILKHRFGADGFNITRVNGENVDSFRGINLEDYIVQREMDINYETRLIFFNGDFLGARKITDRTRPWEDGKNREHECVPYDPSSLEIEESRKILDHFDVTLGCIDWISVGKNGDFYYLETNGVATGYGGYEGAPYDLNEEVASRLREY